MRPSTTPRRSASRRALASAAAILCAAASPPVWAQEEAGEVAAGIGDEKEEAALEEKEEARPVPLPPLTPVVRVPWARHVEVGGGAALVMRPTYDSSGIRYAPAMGFGVHARWDIVRWLRFSAYLVSAVQTVRLPQGALGPPGAVTGQEPDSEPGVDTLAFGGQIGPTLPIGDRARTWVGVGIGYGRFRFDRMIIREQGIAPYLVRERAMSFAEVPFSLGTSVDLIPDWLAIEIEVSAAIPLSQGGSATESAQAIRAGAKQDIQPLPKIDISVVQTLGLSIVL